MFVAAAASEPEANERGSSLIVRRLLYRGFQSLFVTKREELWLWANGRFRMRSGMAQGIVVMREWKIKDAQCKMRDWTISFPESSFSLTRGQKRETQGATILN